MSVSIAWGENYLRGGQYGRKAGTGAETSCRTAKDVRKAASGTEIAGCGRKAVSDTKIAGLGRESNVNWRDRLESSDDSIFCNVYSNYEGYSDPEAFGNSLRYRYSHTISYTSTWFFEAAGNALQQVKEEKETYDGTDVVNAYGYAYAERYSEIEKRYENSGEQWFDSDGTPLTKEKEMKYLNEAYEAAVVFQVSSAKVMEGLRKQWGAITPAGDGTGSPDVEKSSRMEESSKKEKGSKMEESSGIEELKNIFYRARDKYMDMCKEARDTGGQMVLQRFSFGGSALLALLV